MSEPMGQGNRHRQSDFWDGYAALLRWCSTWVIAHPSTEDEIGHEGEAPWVPIVTEAPRQTHAVEKSLARRLGEGVEVRRTRDGGLEARWVPPVEASPESEEGQAE